MKSKKIIIDTDIGTDIDDAFALQLILNSPEVTVMGITTAYQNVLIRAKIAKYMTMLHQKNIGVYCGNNLTLKDFDKIEENEKIALADRPVIEHYLDEMEGMQVETEPAVDFILRTISENPGEITIVTIGPLTNVAAALQKDTKTFNKVKSIQIMGGSVFDERCEWNVFCDAEAASLVIDSEVPVSLYGIDVAGICKMPFEHVDYYLGLKSEKNIVLGKMLKIWLNKHNREPIMYDPLVAGCLIEEFCEYAELRLKIDTDKKRGLTRVLCDNAEKARKVKVAIRVDIQRFMDFLKSRIYD